MAFYDSQTDSYDWALRFRGYDDEIILRTDLAYNVVKDRCAVSISIHSFYTATMIALNAILLSISSYLMK